MIDKANLEDRDLFQVSATIIAGALIFLTISAIATKSFGILSVVYGLVIMILFSISSHCIVVGNRDWALRLMKSGFIFIMVAATVLIILNAIILSQLS
jgi:hypothetical protein